MWACAEKGEAVPDFRERDTLDEVAELLGRAAELLKEPLNGNRLAQHWRDSSQAERSSLPPILLDFVQQLDVVAETARRAHRKRAQRRGPLARQDVRAAVDILVSYWCDELDQTFTHNQWAHGKHGPEPVTKGEQFLYRALAYFAPYRLGELQTICREFSRTK